MNIQPVSPIPSYNKVQPKKEVIPIEQVEKNQKDEAFKVELDKAIQKKIQEGKTPGNLLNS